MEGSIFDGLSTNQLLTAFGIIFITGAFFASIKLSQGWKIFIAALSFVVAPVLVHMLFGSDLFYPDDPTQSQGLYGTNFATIIRLGCVGAIFISSFFNNGTYGSRFDISWIGRLFSGLFGGLGSGVKSVSQGVGEMRENQRRHKLDQERIKNNNLAEQRKIKEADIEKMRLENDRERQALEREKQQIQQQRNEINELQVHSKRQMHNKHMKALEAQAQKAESLGLVKEATEARLKLSEAQRRLDQLDNDY